MYAVDICAGSDITLVEEVGASVDSPYRAGLNASRAVEIFLLAVCKTKEI